MGAVMTIIPMRYTYLVTFTDKRIGRTHTVEPHEFDAYDAQELSELIYDYVRPFLLSTSPEVTVDLEEMSGSVGFGRYATFTIEKVS
jgi:hypothetical protein